MSTAVQSPGSPLPARRRKTSALATASLAAVALVAVAIPAGVAQASAAPVAHAYFVSPTGNDLNDGLSPTSAWRTVARANLAYLKAGDSLRFERGGTWHQRLLIARSGTAAAPITLDAYGSGARPVFSNAPGAECVKLAGSYIHAQFLATSGCAYAGFTVSGHYDAINASTGTNEPVGIKISRGATFNNFAWNVMTNIDIMNINTPGYNCNTPHPRYCLDDSGATAFVINGDDNNIGHNYVSGSIAKSYDFGLDGSAFEVFNGNRNLIHDNVSVDNYVLSEIGRGGKGTADGNVYLRNTVSATCGANCDSAGGITLRGANVTWGPNLNTVISNNSFNLTGSHSQGISCAANCPSSTVITNNTINTARALWLDGSGWTVSGNTLDGYTTAQIGTQHLTVPAGSFMTR